MARSRGEVGDVGESPPVDDDDEDDEGGDGYPGRSDEPGSLAWCANAADSAASR